nr:hypothetical protein At1g50820 [Ipomoea batatas]
MEEQWRRKGNEDISFLTVEQLGNPFALLLSISSLPFLPLQIHGVFQQLLIWALEETQEDHQKIASSPYFFSVFYNPAIPQKSYHCHLEMQDHHTPLLPDNARDEIQHAHQNKMEFSHWHCGPPKIEKPPRTIMSSRVIVASPQANTKVFVWEHHLSASPKTSFSFLWILYTEPMMASSIPADLHTERCLARMAVTHFFHKFGGPLHPQNDSSRGHSASEENGKEGSFGLWPSMAKAVGFRNRAGLKIGEPPVGDTINSSLSSKMESLDDPSSSIVCCFRVASSADSWAPRFPY